MIKKILSFLLSFVLLCYFNVISFASEIGVSAQAAVLLCVNSGEVLYSKNKNKHLPMASTTKIMTSLIAIERATPDREIVVTREMVAVEGTSMGLVEGDSVSLIELVYGMMLQSGNDAANTVAYVLGGSLEEFAVIMNNRAKEIGMNDTNFVTASGLDSKNHYSTAYDMALLAAECIKNPEFRHISSQKSVRLTYGNPPYARTLTNHNRLLWRYSDAIGIKTGFTKKSGRCLVSAAERDGVTLVAVTLNAGDDWNDHITMFEYGFSKCKPEKYSCDLSLNPLKIAGGKQTHVPISLSRNCVFLSNSECSYKVCIKPFEYAPIKKGDIVGSVLFYCENRIIDEIPIIADNSVLRKDYPDKTEDNDDNFLTYFINKTEEFLNNTLCKAFRGELIGRQ